MSRSEEAKEARRARDRMRQRRRRAQRQAAIKTARATRTVNVAAMRFSKTSPEYRRMLGAVPEMTKNQLRAVITAAVRNTQEMSQT